MSIKVNTTVTVTIGDASATITADEAIALRDALIAQFPVDPTPEMVREDPRPKSKKDFPWQDIQPWQVKKPQPDDPFWCRTDRDPDSRVTVKMNV